jgi:hypothetical protein
MRQHYIDGNERYNEQPAYVMYYTMNMVGYGYGNGNGNGYGYDMMNMIWCGPFFVRVPIRPPSSTQLTCNKIGKNDRGHRGRQKKT